MTGSQGNAFVCQDILERNASILALQEHMALTVVAGVNVSIMQIVPRKMALVTVPSQGGLRYYVISLAQGGTMVSTVPKNAAVRVVQLVIQ